MKSKEDNNNSLDSKEYQGNIMAESKFTKNGDVEFDDIAISVEVATEERTCIMDKVNWQMTREFKTWIDLDGIP